MSSEPCGIESGQKRMQIETEKENGEFRNR